ncbi:hypothetical protein BO71DRAFT_397083 [Aspergillus ellipticus CBS 707.79]|uniref:Secreted protein n=1 Tax=Aspergillus ellipticus CBS 707.79 TaxID=1448320 RepID=A0A319DG83_9EURO|nr:hypothetical protein BO71DRAFT_397083 [Aspergillus ellipticus CBS 707.79]
MMSGCLDVWVSGCLGVWVSGCLRVGGSRAAEDDGDGKVGEQTAAETTGQDQAHRESSQPGDGRGEISKAAKPVRHGSSPGMQY